MLSSANILLHFCYSMAMGKIHKQHRFVGNILLWQLLSGNHAAVTA